MNWKAVVIGVDCVMLDMGTMRITDFGLELLPLLQSIANEHNEQTKKATLPPPDDLCGV